MRLRRLAKGKPCLVRIPGVCTGDPATTVLAHYRMPGQAGVGMKPDDLLGAWACSRCHDVVDGREPRPIEFSREDIRLMHAEGILRTLVVLKKQGHVPL